MIDTNFRKATLRPFLLRVRESHTGLRIPFTLSLAILVLLFSSHALGAYPTLQKGQRLPSLTMTGTDGAPVSLQTLYGRVTLISVVPQLNTPVCDEQTHRFSERNGGLDQLMTFVTMSTNTHTDQAQFAQKADINNMTFLSDAPEFTFGKQTGLLMKEIDILQRAVIILDEESKIRYVEIVDNSQLPNFDQAFQAVRRILHLPPGGPS